MGKLILSSQSGRQTSISPSLVFLHPTFSTVTVFCVKMYLQSSWVVRAHDAVTIAGSTHWLGRVLHSWFIAELSTNTFMSPISLARNFNRNQKRGERRGDSNISGNHFPWDPAIKTVGGFSNPGDE